MSVLDMPDDAGDETPAPKKGKRKPAEDDGFLSSWLTGKRAPDPSRLSRRTIKTDKWDREDYENLLKNMPDFDGQRDRLCDSVDTGNALTADTFFAFFKTDPQDVDREDIRPDYMINDHVKNEMRGLREYDELRALGTVGDDVNSALAFMTMRPELESIYDKLRKEQELADQMQKEMEQLHETEQNICTCNWIPLDWGPPQEMPPAGYVEPPEDECGDRYYYPDAPQCEGGEEGEPPKHQPPGKDGEGQGPTDFQSNQELLNRQAQMMRDGIKDKQQQIEQGLKDKAPQIRGGLQKGLSDAVNDAKDSQNSAEAWGLDPGTLQRLPAAERLALAKRLNNPRLKKIAELFGPMKRLMFTEQSRRVNHATDEVYDISKGNDLSRVLPVQFGKLQNPLTKLDFYKDYVEGNLLQYEMRGEEKVGKGGIIYCEDGSGSMSGTNEMWAKAVGLCLLNLAKEQKREFRAIHFGGPNQIWEIAFTKPEDFTTENILAFAEIFFGGGTDFMTPLSRALDHLKGEFDSRGAVHGDIVFATDGACGVQPTWMEEFKGEQNRLNFKVWGIVIGGHTESEPLATICDSRVCRVQDLQGGEDVRNIFGGVG